MAVRHKRANTLVAAIAKQGKGFDAPAAQETRSGFARSNTFHGHVGASTPQWGAEEVGGNKPGALRRTTAQDAPTRPNVRKTSPGPRAGGLRSGLALAFEDPAATTAGSNAIRTSGDDNLGSPMLRRGATGPANGESSPQMRGPASPRKLLQAKTMPGTELASPGAATESTRSPMSPWLGRTQSLNTFSPRPVSRSFDLEAMAAVETGKTDKSAKSVRTRVDSTFGTGERMEPTRWKKWTNLVDKQTLGAHYSFIVGELGAAFALEDNERRAHDERLADDLYRRHPEEPERARDSSAKPPATTAFTDRALRLREGRGARALLQSDEPLPSTTSQTMGARATASPSHARPAGVVSAHFNSNKVPRAVSEHKPLLLEAPPPAADAQRSLGLSAVMASVVGNPEVPEEVEADLKRRFGRKARSLAPASPGSSQALPHRSFTDDDVPIAGRYDQELAAFEISEKRGLRRHYSQDARRGVALVLSPREGDPPPPSKISVLTRAHDFMPGFSEQAVEFTLRANQEIFRFAGSQPPRGRSQPPPSLARDSAGVATGEYGNHHWRRSSPVTMQGKEDARLRLGYDMATPNSSRWFRNSSERMLSHVNHESNEGPLGAEVDFRMQTEPKFRELCKVSQETMEWGKSAAGAIRELNGHRSSPGIRNSLEWVEAD